MSMVFPTVPETTSELALTESASVSASHAWDETIFTASVAKHRDFERFSARLSKHLSGFEASPKLAIDSPKGVPSQRRFQRFIERLSRKLPELGVFPAVEFDGVGGETQGYTAEQLALTGSNLVSADSRGAK